MRGRKFPSISSQIDEPASLPPTICAPPDQSRSNHAALTTDVLAKHVVWGGGVVCAGTQNSTAGHLRRTQLGPVGFTTEAANAATKHANAARAECSVRPWL